MNRSNTTLTLTFDNGPDTAVTPQVLGALKERDLRAVFFPVGKRLEDPANLALMHRAADEGHRIGNHTYSHPRPFGALGTERAVDEIKRTDSLLGHLCEPDRMFRPSAGGGVQQPGVLTQGIVDFLVETKHTLVMWTLVCEDWCRADRSWIDIAMAGMADQEQTLLVLHDIPSGAMDYFPVFLDRVLDAGVTIMTDLPDEAVPIRRGEIVGPVEHLI